MRGRSTEEHASQNHKAVEQGSTGADGHQRIHVRRTADKRRNTLHEVLPVQDNNRDNDNQLQNAGESGRNRQRQAEHRAHAYIQQRD